MEAIEFQIAVEHAWKIQLGRLAIIILAAVASPLLLQYQWRTFSAIGHFSTIWIFAVVLITFAIEWTMSSYQELLRVRGIHQPITLPQFRRWSGKERLHNTVRSLLLCLALLSLLAWESHGSLMLFGALAPVFLRPIAAATARAIRLRRDLQRMSL